VHRRDLAQRIALAGQLNFDHLSAEIGQQRRPKRSRDHGRDIQDAQAQ
jgi:hypothetical protein